MSVTLWAFDWPLSEAYGAFRIVGGNVVDSARFLKGFTRARLGCVYEGAILDDFFLLHLLSFSTPVADLTLFTLVHFTSVKR
jgi:hypothetical protein